MYETVQGYVDLSRKKSYLSLVFTTKVASIHHVCNELVQYSRVCILARISYSLVYTSYRV